MGLGRNKWHFLSFVGTRLSASRVPSGPHPTPLALGGRHAEDFYARKNPTASVGFEPANLGARGQHTNH